MNIKDIFAENHVVIQKESFTCGPCSLLNVLALKGDMSHDELELAERCGATPGVGSSHEDMVRVAREVGLVVIEEKSHATIEDIKRNIDDGAIIIVNFIDQYSGNGHYAVVTEYDEQALYLRDCTSGLFRLMEEYFVNCWRSGDGIPHWYMSIEK